ncbi:MAG TPA: DUF58 domain-containing protein [Burkholderiales bacterium]|nr:DUF58 domain-containing protein [Burkholderiales bacterium]
MLIPAPRLLWLTGALTAGGIAASIWPVALPAWFAACALLGTGVLGDAMAARRLPPLLGRRVMPASLPLGVGHEVSLRLANGGARALGVAVHDHHPSGAEVEGLPRRVTVPARGWAEIRYRFRPVLRGDMQFGRIEARVDSPLRLWQRHVLIGEPRAARVYPNFAELTHFAILATDHRLSQIGLLQRRRRGEGLDFHQLREYREGDSPRQIDWKASVRMARLISREYQDERDQQVVLMLDCGRRMAAKDDALSHFDHVVNAALLLAYVSLRQGDAVGLLTMSAEPRWIAPRKSRATINLILNRVYDLHPTLAPTDYYKAAVDLMQRTRKRALVVMLSNLRDEDDEALAPALKLLHSRHLVLFASLRESILSRALATRADTFERALTHAATADYLRRRELIFRSLERGGAVCVDVEPERLPIALVNSYIDIKRSGRL